MIAAYGNYHLPRILRYKMGVIKVAIIEETGKLPFAVGNPNWDDGKYGGFVQQNRI